MDLLHQNSFLRMKYMSAALAIIFCSVFISSNLAELNECKNFTAFSWEAYAGELFHARSHVYEGDIEQAKVRRSLF